MDAPVRSYNLGMKIAYLVVVIAVIGGGFYWFVLRPANIRADYQKAVDQGTLGAIYPTSVVDSSYEACLHRNGL